MPLGPRSICGPTASGLSRMDMKIYKVSPRKMPRYATLAYHQKRARTLSYRKLKRRENLPGWRGCSAAARLRSPEVYEKAMKTVPIQRGSTDRHGGPGPSGTAPAACPSWWWWASVSPTALCNLFLIFSVTSLIPLACAARVLSLPEPHTPPTVSGGSPLGEQAPTRRLRWARGTTRFAEGGHPCRCQASLS